MADDAAAGFGCEDLWADPTQGCPRLCGGGGGSSGLRPCYRSTPPPHRRGHPWVGSAHRSSQPKPAAASSAIAPQISHCLTRILTGHQPLAHQDTVNTGSLQVPHIPAGADPTLTHYEPVLGKGL